MSKKTSYIIRLCEDGVIFYRYINENTVSDIVINPLKIKDSTRRSYRCGIDFYLRYLKYEIYAVIEGNLTNKKIKELFPEEFL